MLDARLALQIHTGNYNYVQARPVSDISFLRTCINYVASGVSLVDRSDHGIDPAITQHQPHATLSVCH